MNSDDSCAVGVGTEPDLIETTYLVPPSGLAAQDLGYQVHPRILKALRKTGK